MTTPDDLPIDLPDPRSARTEDPVTGISGAWPFLLLGFGLLAVGLSFWRPIPAGVWHDDGVYLVIGQAVAAGDGLEYAGVPGGLPAVKFPPLYPVVLGGLWVVLGSIRAVTLAAVVLNLLFLAAAGALLAYSLHASVGLSRRWAGIFAGLAFVSADLWRPALVTLSESLFVFLLAAALACWPAASRRGDRRMTASLAAVLVAAVLTRSAGVALVVGFGLSLLLRRGLRPALAVMAPAAVAAALWGWWAAKQVSEIPEGLRDVLGPYGGWLAGQLIGAPGVFLAALPAHALAVFERVFALLLPGLSGWTLLAVSVPVGVFALTGLHELRKRFPPIAWVSVAYLSMLLVWPFVDRRLVAPVHPLLAVGVAMGMFHVYSVVGHGRLKTALGAAAFLWLGLLTTVAAARASGGWASAGYQLRAGRMAAAVETLERTAPPSAVVGAPEFWAGLHLHGGWATTPSARFSPRSEDEAVPVWGSPVQQLEIWWGAGVDHVLLEQGGQIHGDALNLLEARCPGSVSILARMPPQMLVRLGWDERCAEALGLQADEPEGR